MARIPEDISTFLAWQFETVIPGTFRRNKADYAHIDFPILAPLPPQKAATPPREGDGVAGPFIYFVINGDAEICYIGKSTETTVVKRWVRPGTGGPSTHYWSHTNKSAGCVRNIAAGIKSGHGPFQLRFVPLRRIPKEYITMSTTKYPHLDPLEQVEKGLQSLLRPIWDAAPAYA